MSEYEWTYIHRRMLADRIRTEAFQKAIEAVVKPGDVVCDVGAGTGILSMFAARAGARKVYAIERTSTVTTAEEIVRVNGLADKIEFINGDAHQIELPEPVDVVVSEWLGNGGFEENMLPAVLSIRDRFLKEGGRMIPEDVKIWMAPVSSKRLEPYVGYFAGDVYGFNYEPMKVRAANERYDVHLRAVNLMTEPQLLAAHDIHKITRPQLDVEVEFEFDAPGILHGTAAWFDSEIGGGHKIKTGPADPLTHWYQVYYPTERPVPVKKGEFLRVYIMSMGTPEGLIFRWNYKLYSNVDALEADRPRVSLHYSTEAL